MAAVGVVPAFDVRPSMGSVGDAYDNALCESFFATLDVTAGRNQVVRIRPLRLRSG